MQESPNNSTLETQMRQQQQNHKNMLSANHLAQVYLSIDQASTYVQLLLVW